MKGGSHHQMTNMPSSVQKGSEMHKGGLRRKSARKSGKRTSRRHRNKTAKKTTLFKFW